VNIHAFFVAWILGLRTVQGRLCFAAAIRFRRTLVELPHLGTEFAIIRVIAAFELAHTQMICIEAFRVLPGVSKSGGLNRNDLRLCQRLWHLHGQEDAGNLPSRSTCQR
jgi:hypothetical protein